MKTEKDLQVLNVAIFHGPDNDHFLLPNFFKCNTLYLNISFKNLLILKKEQRGRYQRMIQSQREKTRGQCWMEKKLQGVHTKVQHHTVGVHTQQQTPPVKVTGWKVMQGVPRNGQAMTKGLTYRSNVGMWGMGTRIGTRKIQDLAENVDIQRTAARALHACQSPRDYWWVSSDCPTVTEFFFLCHSLV